MKKIILYSCMVVAIVVVLVIGFGVWCDHGRNVKIDQNKAEIEEVLTELCNEYEGVSAYGDISGANYLTVSSNTVVYELCIVAEIDDISVEVTRGPSSIYDTFSDMRASVQPGELKNELSAAVGYVLFSGN